MFSPHRENGGMNPMSDGTQQSAFARWLRTGRRPVARASAEIELKFNPWHDPEDGRFTFAGAGQYHGSSGGVGTSDRRPTSLGQNNSQKPGFAAGSTRETLRTRQPANFVKKPKGRSEPIGASRPGDRPNPAAEFLGGVGEELYGVATGSVAAAHSVLTTNPVTTARDVARGIASTIDTVMAAEDTPAAIQVLRAANAVASASARELGRATGSVVGKAVIVAAPGAALGKVTALRSLRKAALRPTYDPPQITWVRENLGRDTAAKRYNDAATGARSGQAPTLMRAMPDGSKRPVKFDGIKGDYIIDRKMKVVDAPRARAQLLRQSEVLTQHRMIGTWEVPSEKQRIAAHKLLKKMKVTNVKIRVVKP